jgi:dTMP kinase
MAGQRGRLLVFEGSEGVGKSTQVARLAARLRTIGRTVTTLREPGGTPLGDEVRRLLLHPDGDVDERAEALLFMASRAQLLSRVVRPALERGDVLLDRFLLSTYAYQVGGRGLPAEEVRAANRLATGGLVPDLTLVLTLPHRQGLDRAAARGAADRMEAADRAFHERVSAAFDEALDAGWQRRHPECGPIVAVDGGGSEDEVAERVWQRLAATWPETFPPSGVFQQG